MVQAMAVPSTLSILSETHFHASLGPHIDVQEGSVGEINDGIGRRERWLTHGAM